MLGGLHEGGGIHLGAADDLIECPQGGVGFLQVAIALGQADARRKVQRVGARLGFELGDGPLHAVGMADAGVGLEQRAEGVGFGQGMVQDVIEHLERLAVLLRLQIGHREIEGGLEVRRDCPGPRASIWAKLLLGVRPRPGAA